MENMINAIEIKWDLLGAKLATLDDNAQSEFFNGFAKELASQSYESHFHRENQMLSINEKLSEDVKKTLEEYLPSLWYKIRE